MDSRDSLAQVSGVRVARAPGVVVAAVEADGVFVAGLGAIEVLVGKVLVPAQCVRIGECGVQLQRALEEPQRRLVLLRMRMHYLSLIAT